MDKSQEIMQQVRRITMQARKQASTSFAGQYRSSFRGQGLDFDDFREYAAGDEPRFIDWKVTARTGTPYVRKFYEEREQIVLLAVDTSASMHYASEGRSESKLEYAARIAAVLAYSAAQNGDKVGLLLYGREQPFYLPPAKGVKQCLRIVREIIASPAGGRDKPMDSLANDILRTQRKAAMLFLISDFLGELDERALGKLDFRHELIPVRLADPCELKLPNAGRVIISDPESGALWEANLSDEELRESYEEEMNIHRTQWKRKFTQLGIDLIDLVTDEDFIHAFSRLFTRRSRHFAR